MIISVERAASAVGRLPRGAGARVAGGELWREEATTDGVAQVSLLLLSPTALTTVTTELADRSDVDASVALVNSLRTRWGS